ncbi:MAG: LysM peptidoglycan-binding domain-containing protein [Chloroflexi bacterium]|nr:LysM peptidoglycan-binding domain-containing protein [Chloroflexota bacterium]
MSQPIERRCPNCGIRISWRAKTCFMCGVRLDEPPRRGLRIAWFEVALVVGILAAVWLWWARGYRPQDVLPFASPSPLPIAHVSPTPISTPTPTPTSTPSPEPTPTPAPIIHIVQAGESLEYIAGNYGLRMDDLIAANDLEDPNLLVVGQKLIIPPPTPDPRRLTPSPTPAGGIVNYEVQRGDTLSAISVRFGVSVRAIQRANKLGDSEIIFPGEVLLIPLPTPEQAEPAGPTPTPTPEGSYRWPAPFLLGPPDEALIASTASPVLRWAAVGLLDEDEWYIVRIWPQDPRLPRPPAYWTKGTSWRVGAEWRPPDTSGERRYFWQVIVVRAEGEGADRHATEATSPMSATRSFIWGQPIGGANAGQDTGGKGDNDAHEAG